MKFYKKLSVLVSLLACGSSAWAQDTIKIGINDQMILVTAPKNNQKVTIIIEDSISNYKVDISRYSSTSAPSIKSDILSRVKRKKTWKSRFFGEVEVGYSGMLNTKQSYPWYLNELGTNTDYVDTFYLGPIGNYSEQGFSSRGTYYGMYLDLTIREKTRLLWKTDNVYLSKGSHIRLSQNFAKGELIRTELYGFEDFRLDSIVSRDAREATLSISGLQVSKRYNLGIYLNKAKDLSVEYGLDIGVRFALSRRTVIDNQIDPKVTSSSMSIPEPGSDMSITFLTLNHRLGFNYKRFSANLGVSYGDLRIGSYNERSVYGKRMTAGLAYRW